MTINKAEIVSELENMVVARLFSRRRWLADREACSAIHRKLLQMGLIEWVCVETQTWRISPLGRELDAELFGVFMGVFDAWYVPESLEIYRLIDESEAEAIYAQMSDENAESVLIGYVKRAYFDYRKATELLH
jgi:hypothetical protein